MGKTMQRILLVLESSFGLAILTDITVHHDSDEMISAQIALKDEGEFIYDK